MLDMRIWNVNHGNSMSIKLPNGNVMMIDCASNPITDFSPLHHTKKLWKNLDYMIISHPHMDHIRDIVNIDSFKPTTLLRPKIDHAVLRNEKFSSNLDIINAYIDFEKRYTEPVTPPNPPTKEWRGDIEIVNYSLNGDHGDLNDYSFVTFISYGSFHFATGGDLSSSGWDRLIEQEGKPFLHRLSKVNFFHASHHGRKEGFNSDVLGNMNPDLVFISDKRIQDTSVTDRYGSYCQGWNVTNEDTGHKNTRKVLTTRKDGRIRIEVSLSDRHTFVKITTRSD